MGLKLDFKKSFCEFPHFVRTSAQRDKLEEAQDEQNLTKLDEPLPECTLSFTHGIGNKVGEKIVSLLMVFMASRAFPPSNLDKSLEVIDD